MTFPFQHNSLSDPNAERPVAADDDGLREIFAPMLAGARARGVADAFALLGLPALLLDATGRVLHAGRGVQDALGDRARLAEQHLVPTRPVDRATLQEFLASAIAVGGAGTSPCVTLGEDGDCVTLEAIRITESDATQLLRAVVLVKRA